MDLEKAFSPERVILDLEEAELGGIVSSVLDIAVDRGLLQPNHRDVVRTCLLESDAEACTPIGDGVAVPHVHLNLLSEHAVMFVRLAKPVNLGAPDGVPVRFLFFLFGSIAHAAKHLDTLMQIARLMSDDLFRSDASVAKQQEEIREAYQRFKERARQAAIKAPSAIPEGLRRTGRFLGGVIEDIKRRWPHYAADYREGFHPKVLASVLFLFFACLAPAVAFGGLMAVMTGGQIGAMEMILATAICGTIFAIFSGQPLTILGGTGPLLVFTALLYATCRSLDIPFLPTYAWVGIWTAIICILLAVTDASFLMRYFTRFTDEIFAALIALIFIVEAVKSMAAGFAGHEVNHDTAFFSLILALGTFYVANQLKALRRSTYLVPKMREFLADFGPAIAIAAMTGVAFYFAGDVHVETLKVPDAFGTTSGREWVVNPFAAPKWVWFAAAGPALLAAVLVYLDQNITARLINNPENKTKKGPGYHLDLGLVGLLIGICSFLGLPWLVAATVRSLNHVRSLATVETVTLSGGRSHERIVSLRENRVSALAIHLLIGLSLLVIPLLKQIPMPVLFGIFLYMGVASMEGIQFFERLRLWLTDPRLYPSTHYTRQVPMKKIHFFTVVQSICLAVLWVVKVSAIGLLFPLVLCLLVPVRFLLKKFFKPEELAALDAEEEPIEEINRYE